MKFIYNDGGRAAAGYKGSAGDCVTRAIAIATGKPYQEVYEQLFESIKNFAATSRSRSAKLAARGGGARGTTPRNGVSKTVIRRYLESLGWAWTPTMGIGTGCKVHLHDGELPSGKLIVSVSKHLVAVINGEIHDTHNPQRETHAIEPDHGGPLKPGQTRNANGICSIQRRCVYGYWSKP